VIEEPEQAKLIQANKLKRQLSFVDMFIQFNQSGRKIMHLISGFEANPGLLSEEHDWEQDCDVQAYY